MQIIEIYRRLNQYPKRLQKPMRAQLKALVLKQRKTIHETGEPKSPNNLNFATWLKPECTRTRH